MGATLKEAEFARSQFADELAKRGAHAVGVEQLADKGWAVVAYVEKASVFEAPETLNTTRRGSELSVPLLVRRENMAKPE